MVFPVVKYGCESWTVKKAECRRIAAFELWCWRRLLRVPWTPRRSNQSILKEINSGISLEGMMLKLKLHYFGHLMQRVDSLEKTLILGGIRGRRKRGWQRMRWLDGITDSMDVSLSWWWTGRPGVLQFMGSQRVGHDWVTELNWMYFWEAVAIYKSLDWMISFSEDSLEFSLSSLPNSYLGSTYIAQALPSHLLTYKLMAIHWNAAMLITMIRKEWSAGKWAFSQDLKKKNWYRKANCLRVSKISQPNCSIPCHALCTEKVKKC